MYYLSNNINYIYIYILYRVIYKRKPIYINIYSQKKRIMNQRRIYTYESELRGMRKVCCTYREYLFLKLYYSADGLTEEECETYKRLSNDESSK